MIPSYSSFLKVRSGHQGTQFYFLNKHSLFNKKKNNLFHDKLNVLSILAQFLINARSFMYRVNFYNLRIGINVMHVFIY